MLLAERLEFFISHTQLDARILAGIYVIVQLDQLVRRPPEPDDVWAVGVQRIVPGAGFQSWTRPATIDVEPQGFGYLIFD